MTEPNCLNVILATTILTQVSHYLIHLMPQCLNPM